MLGSLKLWGKSKDLATQASGATGARAYAIGDIHGRLDLLDEMLALIAAEESRRERRKTYLVLLGDLIDRGPESAGVIERLCTMDWEYIRPVFILGNHEEMLLRVLGDEPDLVHDWLRHGGYECAQSYRVPVGRLAGMAPKDAVAMLQAHIPEHHVSFLQQFADSFRFGDYLFVHAGIRPGVPIERQTVHDLRWIREGFLDNDRDDGFVVVHGHTIVTAAEERRNRIGIDTGAYMGGPLTALVVEGRSRTFLTVGGKTD